MANRVSVEDRLTEIVSHSPVLRSGTQTLHLDTDHLDPDELDPMKEINVSLNPPTSETRNRRRLLMAAAAVVVVIGVAGIALANNNATTIRLRHPLPHRQSRQRRPSPRRRPSHPRRRPVSFAVDECEHSGDVHRAGRLDRRRGVGDPRRPEHRRGRYFDEVANIYADGCQWVLVDPPVGPTVDDLVAAWANVPDFAATAAVDVTVDGYAGKQIEFTVPDYTTSECKGNRFGLWHAWTSGDGDAPGYWAQGPNQHHQAVDPRRRRHPPRDHRVRTSRAPRRRTEPPSTRSLASIQIG